SCEHCRKIVAAAITGKTLAVGTPQPDVEDVLASAVDVSISGRYVIEAVLGRGGMGTVYLARDQTLSRDVALKLHRAGSGNDRLHREAIAMAKLAHPNVVTVFEIGSVDDRMYVAMEYVRGETLRGWLDASKRPWRTVIDMLAQAGAGLAAAHAAGLIHRDFKPENVLVGEDGRPRVSDFGLARVGVGRDDKPTGVVTSMTQTGAILGTPAYMSPEQLAGDPVDARCDQFAFCVVVWESLFGKRPFAGNTLAALEDAIQRQDIQRSARSDVPPRVRDVIERGLAVNAADRYTDMQALLVALRAAAVPRTKKYLAVGLAAGVLLAAGGYAASSFVGARRHAAECDAAADNMRVLDPLQRENIRRAFIATGAPSANDTFERAAAVLDRYSGILAEHARATCENTTEPLSLLAARQSCLADRRSEMAVLVDVISKPDASVVQRAPSTAWAIYDPKPCSDRAVLLASSIVPVTRPREVVANLGRTRTLYDAGQYEEAARVAATVVDDARARKDRGLELEALIEVASAKAELDPQAAVPIYEQAVQLAEALGRDLDAAGALGGLANLAGVSQNDYHAAHRYIALALAKLDRMGGDNLSLRGSLAATEAQVYSDENRLGEAETSIRQAAAALEQAYGPVHPKVGAVYGTLAQILRYQDKDSQPASERTVSIMRDTLGPEHPTTAGAEMTLGQVLADKGHYDEALKLYAHADVVFAKSFGEHSLVRGSLFSNVATLELQRENWDAALTGYRKALAIIEANEGPDAIDASGAHSDIARALASKGDMKAAFAEMDRSITIVEKAGSDGDPRLIGRLTELAEYQIVAKQPAAGVATAERALAITKKRPADANPVEVGQLDFILARGLWDSNGDRQRARTLVSEALELSQDSKERAMYQTWLAEHPL
ncbi:MAG TPA: serine/threonine-protein kinase, partial [Kofleriaceae bacterium]|nr:serine/threonine-protein kinase [Kofleriaceae bacterium]